MIDLLIVPQRLRALYEEADKLRLQRQRQSRATPEEINERNDKIRARYKELRSLRKVGHEFELSHERVRKVLGLR